MLKTLIILFNTESSISHLIQATRVEYKVNVAINPNELQTMRTGVVSKSPTRGNVTKWAWHSCNDALIINDGYTVI